MHLCVPFFMCTCSRIYVAVTDAPEYPMEGVCISYLPAELQWQTCGLLVLFGYCRKKWHLLHCSYLFRGKAIRTDREAHSCSLYSKPLQMRQFFTLLSCDKSWGQIQHYTLFSLYLKMFWIYLSLKKSCMQASTFSLPQSTFPICIYI